MNGARPDIEPTIKLITQNETQYPKYLDMNITYQVINTGIKNF